MSGVIEAALAVLVVYLIGCIGGYAARRASRPGVRRTTQSAPTASGDSAAAESDVDETASPFDVATSMPARPRRANVRVVVPAPPLDDAADLTPDVEPEPIAGFPFALAEPRDGKPDDLKQINGIGPKLEARLHEAGVFHLDQLAALNKKAAAMLDERLGLGGRVVREEWSKQAKALRPRRAKGKPRVRTQ